MAASRNADSDPSPNSSSSSSSDPNSNSNPNLDLKTNLPSPSPFPSKPAHPRTPIQARTLILVPCHAIYLGSRGITGDPTTEVREDNWAIEAFQGGETPTFAAHARAGIEYLIKAEGSHAGGGVLIFSGGVTKPERTELSEAESYISLIRACGFLPSSHSHLAARVLAETYATDSFQNLLFSLLLFVSRVGRAPSKIVVVTHAFKAKRFVELHAKTLRIPCGVLTVRGIDPPGLDEGGGEGRRAAERGEEVARKEWEEDWWGWGEKLKRKRMRRGCKGEVKGMHDVAGWNGGESRKETYPGVLPWEYGDGTVDKGWR